MTIRNPKRLFEARTLVCGESRDDGSFKVKIINEGKGSSGIYPAELLERSADVFSGVLSFKNHPDWNGPQSRDFTMISGKVLETWVAKDEFDKTAIFGWYLPDPEYAAKIERYKDDLGLSIYINGDGYMNEDGEFVVDWFDPVDPWASVDIVVAAGRGGALSTESLKESMKKVYNVDPEEGRTNRKETTMDLETLATKLDALTTTVLALASDKEAEASESAQAKADDEAVAKAVESYAAKVEAIAKAELPAVLAESLRKDALAGADVEVKITEAKALTEALKTELTESGAGRVIEGSDDDYTLKGFGGK